MSYYVFSIGWYLSNDFYSLIFFNFPVFILLLSLQPIFKSWQKKSLPVCVTEKELAKTHIMLELKTKLASSTIILHKAEWLSMSWAYMNRLVFGPLASIQKSEELGP